MKKTYIHPSTKVVTIEVQQMLAYSDPVTGAKFNPNSQTSGMDSRGFSDWDDDEEEF